MTQELAVLKNALILFTCCSATLLNLGSARAAPFGDLSAGPLATMSPEMADAETKRWLMVLPQEAGPRIVETVPAAADAQPQGLSPEAFTSIDTKIVAPQPAPEQKTVSAERKPVVRVAAGKTITGRSSVRSQSRRSSPVTESVNDPLPAKMNPPISLQAAPPQVTTYFPQAQLQSPFGEVLTH